MQQTHSRVLFTAAAIGLMSASLVTMAKLPAQSARSLKTKTCNSASACLQYRNAGTGDAIDGTSSPGGNGNGVYGVSNGTGSTGVIGRNFAGGWGLYGQTSGPAGPGAGVAAYSTNGNVAMTASVASADSSALVFSAYNAFGTIAAIDDFGNIGISGLIFTNGDCGSGCSRTRHVKTYAPREAAPTVEDVGEAHLVAGRASVDLDRSFANVIDAKAGYAVLLTPEGDSRGLYVAQREPGGFEVRESQAGRATIAFAYRIVAHPYGVVAARLPFVNDKPAGSWRRPR